MLLYSVVIPSRRSPDHLHDILSSLSQQTHPASAIYLVLDIDTDHHDISPYETLSATYRLPQLEIVSHLSHPSFVPARGVSNVRNYGLSLVQTPLVLCIDDDNAFSDDFCQQLTLLWNHYLLQYPHLALLCPTEREGTSDTILSQGSALGQLPILSQGSALGQPRILSQGFCYYNYRLARPQQSYIPTGHDHHIVSLIGSNCLRGSTHAMTEVTFDDSFPFVAEDLDYTQTLTDRGYTLIVTSQVHVRHLQRPKNPLQQAYVGDPASAYQKGKNRILFVRKHGTSLQQLIARFIGIPGNTIRLTAKILLSTHHSWRQKRNILTAFRRGTRHGRWQSSSHHTDHGYT